MFIPSNCRQEINQNTGEMQLVADQDLSCYDVNSLYPFIMANSLMPTGKIYYFEGDRTKTSYADRLGFYYCKVTAPADLIHPIIQLHIDNNGNKCTMSPLGEFNAVIYSEEIKNAIKYGYKFEIINGYFFGGKDYIFKKYINQLYELRLNYAKDHPMNFIAKILMNSLYGAFGMVDKFDTVTIHENAEFEHYMNKISVKEAKLLSISELGNEHMIISKEGDRTNLILSSLSIRSNVNVAIAGATTSLSRIHMSQFKNNPLFDTLYSDTDSIIVNLSHEEFIKLFPDMIGNKLGQLKLEYIIKKAVFLGPKSYFLELENGKNIIKIKGLSSKVANNSDITIESFYELLKKDSSMVFNQEKWKKSLSESTINILNQSYKK